MLYGDATEKGLTPPKSKVRAHIFGMEAGRALTTDWCQFTHVPRKSKKIALAGMLC